MDYLLIFKNTHYALACEKIFTQQNVCYNIMPSPSQVSNSCGISIAVKNNDLEMIKGMLEKKIISVKCIYDVKNNNTVYL